MGCGPSSTETIQSKIIIPIKEVEIEQSKQISKVKEVENENVP